jgi:hypothetical protein
MEIFSAACTVPPYLGRLIQVHARWRCVVSLLVPVQPCVLAGGGVPLLLSCFAFLLGYSAGAYYFRA